MYSRCFPSSLNSRIMGSAGRVDHSILERVSATTWKASCPSGNPGIISRGATYAEGEAHGECPGGMRVRQVSQPLLLELAEGFSGVDLLCAHVEWHTWIYASSSGTQDALHTSPDVDTEVLVVGSGMGGHASAMASINSGNTNTRMVSGGNSTTERSTGVVWFPINHTLADLMQAHGSAEAIPDAIQVYLSEANASFAYWNASLLLHPYPTRDNPVYDYTDYSQGPKRNNSFQATTCDSLSSSEACGGATLLRMKTAMGTDLSVSDTSRVVSVVPGPFSMRVTLKNPTTGLTQQITTRSIVFASGGSGRYQTMFPSGRVLAGSENDGVHLTVATALGMQKSRNDIKWGLEFIKQASSELYEPHWFSFGCAPQGLPSYNVCADYNARVAAYGQDSAVSSFVSTSQCTSQSFLWWQTFFDGLYGSPVTQADSAKCAGGLATLAAGIIDGKQGFLLNQSTMESIDIPGIFAAGTTAAYPLGNTYFGPGATLGWALHSGRLAGQHAALHAHTAALMESKSHSVHVPKKPRDPYTIRAFRIASWLLLFAVAAHVVSQTAVGTSAVVLRYIHYGVAPAAAVWIIHTGYSAATRKTRIMKAINSPESRFHAYLGGAAVALMAAQISLGFLVKTVRSTAGTSNGGSDVLLTATAWIHRALGLSLVFIMGTLYWTSRKTATLYNDNITKGQHTSQAVAFGVCAFVTILASVVLYLPKTPSTYTQYKAVTSWY